MKLLTRICTAANAARRTTTARIRAVLDTALIIASIVIYAAVSWSANALHSAVSWTSQVLRMVEWLLVAALFYWIATRLPISGHYAPIQTLLWKLGHVTLGGFIGYWLDRMAFRDRISCTTPPLTMIRRAVIMAASMYTLGTGL